MIYHYWARMESGAAMPQRRQEISEISAGSSILILRLIRVDSDTLQ
jgi:hypothetical protein